jgi:DNA-binding MarR family transcriptional regulator
LTVKGREVLERAVEIAIETDARLCSQLDEKEHDELIDLLQKLQPALVERPGVHPAIAREHPVSGD